MSWPDIPLGRLCVIGPQFGMVRSVATVQDSLSDLDRPGDVRYVSAEDIDYRGRLGPPRLYVSSSEAGESILDDGDILISRRGPDFGRVYRYRVNDGSCTFGRSLIRIRPDPYLVSPRYLERFLNTRRARAFLANHRSLDSHRTDYASLPVPLATRSEQRWIVERLAQVDDIRALRATATAKLSAIEAALGQRRVGQHDPDTAGLTTAWAPELERLRAYQARSMALIERLFHAMLEQAFTGLLIADLQAKHSTILASERAEQAKRLEHHHNRGT